VQAALRDAAVAAILVDVVLGYGGHPDPAGVLLRNDMAAKPVIASITGTERDPQVYSRQAAALREAGVVVAASNAHAANLASACSPR
jgi:FdrA protein